ARETSREKDFDHLISAWFPLTYMLNNFNRGLGLSDAYPFVLTGSAIEKLRFIHDIVQATESNLPAHASANL
ncbi:MAG: putative zinc-binding metallopeptidase, partial [Pyrinomonadaceae bacterium]|nr:putative zinc-binding metallopeptidase [Phycisphaerales bacterium]